MCKYNNKFRKPDITVHTTGWWFIARLLPGNSFISLKESQMLTHKCRSKSVCNHVPGVFSVCVYSYKYIHDLFNCTFAAGKHPI